MKELAPFRWARGSLTGRSLRIGAVPARLGRAVASVATLIRLRTVHGPKLAERLTQYCRQTLAVDDVVVTVSVHRGTDAHRHPVVFTREGDRIDASCVDRFLVLDHHGGYVRLAAVLAVVARLPRETFPVIADMSDGETAAPGFLGFCTRVAGTILIPDLDFIFSRGYEENRHFAQANRIAWQDRSDCIVWRGSTTGYGNISSDPLSADDPGLLPRVRLCLRLHGVPGTDVKISRIIQSLDPSADTERLARAGIMSEAISPRTWNRCKFAIDIDGNSNAWSNLFMRLLMGCCVLKVASPSNYRQWYYDDFEPWTHYVPVKTDLSDLLERIDWCRANLDTCGRIAANGQAFAMARSYESEIASSVERVCSAFRDGSLRRDLA